ncbi:hypothetical protein DP113_29650 [Brasilonema octagenarum UFV-E1]|uniref:Addiction module component n=2 Tax=Brasilonema TaxID=383614 RepID=A0A856MPK6_9CYAN|nr:MULTISPECIES: hypothetical protein [Brasilonema]NMF61347.1 hypothetical protein [Brasilonema octagenarum UFV-OR1]QDL11481.1 hypothetical protein DP114_29490 [Brasilonema sennae CENA114]QDL17864.1 hypothetical protein DP113_29650 [Brasilonema octagenarum UFV-E1]
MSSLAQIKTAIAQLPEVEARKLLEWFQAYLDQAWDRQIEADVKSGRLNSLLQRAEADIAANRVKPIDEILNNS